MSKFKVTFTLDEADAEYFRTLYRKAKRGAKQDLERLLLTVEFEDSMADGVDVE